MQISKISQKKREVDRFTHFFRTKRRRKNVRIPHSLKETTKKEVARLVEQGVLSPIKYSEWVCPSFAIPKKNKVIRFISDFRGLDKKIKRKLFSLPLMNDIIPSIGKFKYATTIDRITGYYRMLLNEKARERCMICLPWVSTVTTSFS